MPATLGIMQLVDGEFTFEIVGMDESDEWLLNSRVCVWVPGAKRIVSAWSMIVNLLFPLSI